MTREQKSIYHETDELRKILIQTLKGKKFKLDCGHHITFGFHLGNDITIINGSQLKVICSQCGY